jgi:hypothetical protein
MIDKSTLDWANLPADLGFFYPEPDYHPAWARYENMCAGITKSTPEELEAARIAAEKEGHNQFKKTKGAPPESAGS